jgi:hypothetical protein
VRRKAAVAQWEAEREASECCRAVAWAVQLYGTPSINLLACPHRTARETSVAIDRDLGGVRV